MKVKELIEILETCNPEADIWLDCGDRNCIVAEEAEQSMTGEEVIISM